MTSPMLVPNVAWRPVIGLEVHAQLATRTKAFCGCATSFGDPPNTHGCAVCLGLPGALPTLNREAVALAIRAGLAFGCTIRKTSAFARKHYFYADLPKGYQITQFDSPLAVKGRLHIQGDGPPRSIGIARIHLEEDAGKSLHDGKGQSRIDLNRAGTPLIEIVSEPELRSAAEARQYLERVRETLMFVGVNDGNLEEGSFRCDANVSVSRPGEPLGVRVELKNINSFRFVEAAILGEVRRQVDLLERGQAVTRQTRGYDAERDKTFLLREKEGEDEYRYLAEPDLPLLEVSDPVVEAERARLPELPEEKRVRFVEEYGLRAPAAAVLTSHPRIAAFFEEAVRGSNRPVRVANLIQTDVLGRTSTHGLEASFPFSPQQIAELADLIDSGAISGKQAKQLLADLVGSTESPRSLVAQRGLQMITDEGALRAIAIDLVAAHPEVATAFRSGKRGVLGFLVGELMKATGGHADPKLASRVLLEELEA